MVVSEVVENINKNRFKKFYVCLINIEGNDAITNGSSNNFTFISLLDIRALMINDAMVKYRKLMIV